MKQNNAKIQKFHIKCVKVDATVCSAVGIGLKLIDNHPLKGPSI